MPRYRSDVHVDQALTNISLAYSQSAGFVGNLLFPTVPVAKDSFKYFTYGRGVFGDGNTRLEWVDGSNPPAGSTSPPAPQVPALRVPNLSSHQALSPTLLLARRTLRRASAREPFSSCSQTRTVRKPRR